MSEKSVLCKICHESYSVKQINYHISICSVCKYCEVVFEDFHQKKSHSCPESLKICNICLKKFDLTKSLYAKRNYQRHTRKCGELSNRKRAFINAANADSGNVDASYEVDA